MQLLGATLGEKLHITTLRYVKARAREGSGTGPAECMSDVAPSEAEHFSKGRFSERDNQYRRSETNSAALFV